MRNPKLKPELVIWGGLECTINRVEDRFFDQSEYSGHEIRNDDIAQFARLGIKKIRYPILWEKHQAEAGKPINWETAEIRLNQIRANGIDPIAGLLHHGSGPAFTNLLDPEFPEKFAAYARQVANRFPWINYYTPINEPLTTARFSGLYGLWYPHSRDDLSFIKILINQCKASLLAMESIRKINSGAVWLQTEDLGKTHSTATLSYQADFENERRWLGFDLMAGKVNKEHPLWDYILWTGLNPKELDFFQAQACEPDMIGFNYYLTSERFLDEKIENYPAHTHGANTKHVYADVEAVRTVGNSGLAELLREAWQHLKKPMAITEVHLNCSRDEQLRWFDEIWQETKNLLAEGFPIYALTAWALLGSFGWNKLLTQEKGGYEAGVFDISNGQPRPTALFRLIRQISAGKKYVHPVLNQPGWWKRSGNEFAPEKYPEKENIKTKVSLNPILIIGKNGTLGKAFARICEHRALDYQLLGRPELDITNPSAIEMIIKKYKPWAIINTAGFVKVDEAEEAINHCFMSNTSGAENLAQSCGKHGIQLVSFSSDLVFDGNKDTPYLESDTVAPLNIYGHSKAWAEKRILGLYPEALMIRSSSFFGPWDQANFVSQVRYSLNLKQEITAANDIYMSPTYIPELVNTSLDLLIDREKGIWHLANQACISWADFATEIAQRAGYSSKKIKALPAGELNYKAKRPKYSVLGSERGANLDTLEQALNHYFLQEEIKSKSF